MVTVTVADFQNRFKELVRSAEREPVSVHEDGETKLIALSPAEYRRLLALAAVRSGADVLDEIPADAAAEIAAAVDEVRAELTEKRRGVDHPCHAGHCG